MNSQDKSESGFDLARCLAGVGGDRDILRFRIELFLDTYPGEMSAMREALVGRDAEGLRSAAHKFQAQVGAFSETARQTASRLARLGQASELDEAETVYTDLEGQVERLQSALRRWLGEGGTT